MTEAERIRAEFARRDREIPPDFYSLDRPANRFLYEDYTTAARALLRESGVSLAACEILEVGCGRGQWLADLVSWGARPERVHGVDLDEGRLADARARLPAADLRAAEAAHLPHPDGIFDLVLQATMMTSILDGAERRAVAGEMVRVLRGGGLLLWYDFVRDNPRNRRVRGIPVGELHGLFPGLSMSHRRVTLAPPIARILVPRLRPVASLLRAIPLLRTHVVAVLRKPA